MKNLNKYVLLKLCIIASISVLFFSSCSQNDENNSGSVLSVTSVSKSVVDDPLIENDRQVDVLTDEINAGNTYIIRGTGFGTLKSISFNGLESAFNSTLVTNEAIVINVDKMTPYYNEKDEMIIVTSLGTLVYKIKVRPPFPSIKGFPINAEPGDIITITGDFFLRPVVNFGTTAVEPISSTLTEIKVQVPADNYHQFLSVTNVSGTTVAGQAFGTAIYDDAYTSLHSYDGLWNADDVYKKDYDKDVAQGSKCISWKAGKWNGLYVGVDKTKIDITQFKSIRVSLKGEKTGTVNAIINSNYGKPYKLSFKTDWTYLEIPFSEVGDPAELLEIVFQESSNVEGGNLIFIDDLGLVLKK
jgi:hypothetical protein